MIEQFLSSLVNNRTKIFIFSVSFLFVGCLVAAVIFSRNFLLTSINSDDNKPDVLAEKTSNSNNLLGEITFNVPAIFTGKTFFHEDVKIVNKNLDLGTGSISASNIIYSLRPGSNISITGDRQNPTINASVSGSFVTSLQGQSGAVAFVSGTGITVDGLTITNSDPGSAQNIFKNIEVGSSTITAGSNNDTLQLSAGNGISLGVDGKKVTITNTSPSGGGGANGIIVSQDDTPVVNPATTLDFAGSDFIVTQGPTGEANITTVLGTSIDLTSEVTGILPIANGGTGANTLADLIALGTDTTGNYVATLTGGNGISITNGTGEGVNPSSALGPLTANWDQTGAFDIVLNNANADLQILESVGDTFYGTIDVGNLSSNRTYTFPDSSGTVCIFELGNCGGGGGGNISGSGTNGQISFFNGVNTITSETTGFTWDATNKRLGLGTDTPQGKLDVQGSATGKALAIFNQTGDQHIIAASSSGTTRLTLDTSGNLNIIGGAYQIGGTNVLTSTTLGASVVNSSLTSVGALTSGSIANGFGTIATTNTITGTTLNGTTGLNTGAGAGTQRIDASGNLVNIGTITASGLISANGGLTVTNGQNLTLAGLTSNNNSVLYTDGTGNVLAATTTGTGQCLTSNGAGAAPSWAACPGGDATNYWQLNNGALSPFSNTLDVLVGGTSTASAKFGFLNVAAGTPTASISGTTGGLYLTADGKIATTAKQTLTLGDSTTTGNVIINPSGNVGIGTTAPTAMLNVQSNADSNVSVLIKNRATQSADPFRIVNANDVLMFDIDTFGGLALPLGKANFGQPVGIGVTATSTQMLRIRTDDATHQGLSLQAQNGQTADLLNVLDGSSNVLFSFDEVGNLRIGQAAVTADTGKLNVTGAFTGKALTILNETGNQDIFTASSAGITRFTIANNGNLTATGTLTGLTGLTSSGTITFSGLTTDGGLLYTNGSGTVAQTTAGSLGQCLTSNGGGTPTWSPCAGANYWQVNNGALSPFSNTLDVLVGGTSTASAKFGFLNVSSGTPTATISGATGGIYIMANGNVQTTNNQNLTIGGDTTGNITLSPLNGDGTVLSTGNLNLSTGKTYQIGGTTVLSNNTLGAGVVNSSLTSVGTITSGTWNGTAIGTQYGGTGQNWSAIAQGALPYFSGTGVMSTLAAGNAGQCLMTNGASQNPSWGDCSNAANYWQLNNGAISPFSDTLDVLVGGTASNSAKFKISPNGTSPTASVSATSSYAGLVVDNTTGDLFTASSSGQNRFVIKQNGNVGVGTTSPNALLELASVGGLSENGFRITSTATGNSLRMYQGTGGNSNIDSQGNQLHFNESNGSPVTFGGPTAFGGVELVLSSYGTANFYANTNKANVLNVLNAANAAVFSIGTTSTDPTATIAANTTNAALVVDNRDNGDLIAASSSGLNRFVVKQNGNVGIGSTLPATRLHIADANASNNVLSALRLERTNSTAAGDVGLGTAIDFYLEDSGSNVNQAGRLDVTWTGATNSAETSQFVFNVMQNGTLTPAATLSTLQRVTGDDAEFKVNGRLDQTHHNWFTDFFSAEGDYTANATTLDNLVFNENGSCTGGVFQPINVLNGIWGNSTGTTNGNACFLTKNQFFFNASLSPIFETRVNSFNRTSSTVWTGFSDRSGNTTTDPSNGIYFKYSASGNWIATTRLGGTQTTTDTGIVPSTGSTFQVLRIEASASQVKFYIDGTLKAVHTTNIPTADMTMEAVNMTNTNALRELEIDYFKIWQDPPPADFQPTNPGANRRQFDIERGADLAERYPVTDIQNTEFGEIMTIDPSKKGYVKKTTKPYDPAIVGVTSQSPGKVLGDASFETMEVALSGRVPVKISSHSEPIQPGDYLTSSDEPGKAMKATTAGPIIGKALEAWTLQEGKQTVLVFIQNGWNNPQSAFNTQPSLTKTYDSNDTSLQEGSVVMIDEQDTNAIERTTKAYDFRAIGVLSAKGTIETDKLSQSLVTMNGPVLITLASDSASIKAGDFLTTSSEPGKAMKAKDSGVTIAKALEDWQPGGSQTVLAFVNLSSYDADTAVSDISDLNLAVDPDSQSGKYKLTTSTGEEIARIGRFAETAIGNVKAGSVDTQALSINGINIFDLFSAKSADKTKQQFADLGSKMDTLEQKVASNEAKTTSALQAMQKLIEDKSFGVTASQSAQIQSVLGTLDVNAATISGTLNVLGRTTINELGVTGNITAGVLSINGLDDGNATINTMGGDLKLQSAGVGGIDILAGKITIDRKGNMTIKENLTAKTVTTTKLNVVEDTTATPSADNILSASAGSVIIKEGQTSIDVTTTALTSKSLLFVTPDQPVAVGTKAKDKDTFTIKLQEPLTEDLQVNWWIVN